MDSMLRARRAFIAVVAACLTWAALAGCAEAPDAGREQGAPAALVYDPAGGAAGNLDYFVQTLHAAAGAGADRAALRAVLAEAGFPTGQVESTPDGTTLDGVAADFLQIGVRMPDGDCLIGQLGPDRAVSAVVAAPMAATGRCLVGDPDREFDEHGRPVPGAGGGE